MVYIQNTSINKKIMVNSNPSRLLCSYIGIVILQNILIVVVLMYIISTFLYHIIIDEFYLRLT